MTRNSGLSLVVAVCLGAVFTTVAGAAPLLSSLSPDYGSGMVGTVVTIHGTGLSVTGVTRVLFGDADASEVAVSDSGGGNFSLSCKTPPHWGGLCSVTVINPDQSSATLADAYVFVPGILETNVTGALPCFSPTAGGKTIFVVGQEAGLPFSLYTLTIGGVPITGVREYRVQGHMPLYSAVSPPHAAGLVGFGIVGYGELLPNCFIYSDATAPLVLSCSPTHDWDYGGAEVDIVAGNLPLTGTPTVSFGGVESAIVVVHPDFGGYITCAAPPHIAGLVDIVVTNPDGQSGTLPGAFNYDSTYQPKLDSLSPNEGPGYQSNYVTITGSGFAPTGGTTQVTFGGVPATDVFVGGGTILYCHTPLHAAGTVDVVVTNPGGKVGSLANGYTFLPPLVPVPTVATPNSGQEAGGTMVTIAGTGFMLDGYTQVSFGDHQSNNVLVKDAVDGSRYIICQTPGHAPGTVDIVVTNPGNTTGTLAGGFTYLPQTPPSLVSVTPGEGSTLGGDSVTLYGTGFTPYQPLQVTFGGMYTSSYYVQAVDDHTLICSTPVHAAGEVDVAVIAADGTTGVLPGGFLYVDAPPPTIDTVSPDADLTTGGTAITVTGTGFCASYNYSGSVKVLLGGVEAFSVYASSSSHIVCYTPVHSPGPVDVEIVNPDGKRAVLPGGFTYVDAPSPHPLGLTPAHGLTLGGATVSISGSDFCTNGYTPTKVLFGEVESTSVSAWNISAIQCKTPPHAPGTVDVTVVNPDGKVGVIPGGFTYLATMNPVISRLGESLGYATGGSSLAIYGTDFSLSGTTRVTFDGAEAVNVRVYDAGDGTMEIACRTPHHAPGMVDVTVFNPGGGEATLHSAYLYILGPPPMPEKITPTEGPSTGGTPVVISGNYFGRLGTLQVTFGAEAATGVRVISEETISCLAPPQAPGTVDVTVINEDGQSGTLPGAFVYRAPAVKVVRVDADNVSGTEDGTGWETAFTSIQSGIDAIAATGEPGEVWVAGSTYTGTEDAVVVLQPFCDVYGGFAGTETARGERDFKAHAATIDGENVRACVYGADNARLDGFVITRGNGIGRFGYSSALAALLSTFGGYSASTHLLAIDNSGVSPTIANCTITGNSPGLAVMANVADFTQTSCPLITGCIIADNGEGAYAVMNAACDHSLCLSCVSNSTFARNWVGVLNFDASGGICMPAIRGCIFSANTFAGVLAGSLDGTCRAQVENCLFTQHENRILDVEGTWLSAVELDVVNCTIAGNPTTKNVINAPYSAWGGVARVNVVNSIVWGNGGALAAQNYFVDVRASFSDAEGGYAGTGNIDTDPQFVDGAAGNYQLQTGSPCVDTGTAEGAPAVDLLGVPRPQRGGYDMGAYEVPNPVPAPDVVGQTQDAAAETLAAAGFTAGTVAYQYSLTVPAGTVLSQTPDGGTDVQPGSAIDLVLSRGGLTVPDVVGKPQVAAVATLRNAMLVAGAVTEQYSATVPSGTVMAQTPAAGTSVLPSTAVNLTVSLGVQPSVMPDVLGQPQAQAESALTAAGLVPGTVMQDHSDSAAAGTVLSQSPSPGAELPSGTVVSIVVSLGPAPPVPETAEGEGETLNADTVKQQLAAVPASADANADERLSFEEAAAAVPGLTRAQFDALDTNHDGLLASDELGNDDFSGCAGRHGNKSGFNTVSFGRRMGDLFLAGLGFLDPAAIHRP